MYYPGYKVCGTVRITIDEFLAPAFLGENESMCVFTGEPPTLYIVIHMDRHTLFGNLDQPFDYNSNNTRFQITL